MSVLVSIDATKKESTNLTAHVGIADCCDAQGLPAPQIGTGGGVIVAVEELDVVFELRAGWVDDEEGFDVEFVL